ncbi:MAG: rod shape-determining protein RodA [Candidatus Omnitrophota bacterium]
MEIIKTKKYKGFDWILVICVFVIFMLGLLLLFSSTYPNNIDYVSRQMMWFLLGVLISVFIINMNYRKIVGIGNIFYFITIFLLVLVLLVGSRRFGAQRWLRIGAFNIQPSEFAKLFITLAIVQYLVTHKTYSSFKNIAAPLAMILVPFVLILKEPDLGTALMFIPIVLILLYTWGVPLKNLCFIMILGFLSCPLGWFFLKEYQKDRLLVFIDPNIDPLGAGYTIIQSRIAIGSGELLGKGWLSGTQNQLNFLAERHTDFVFSVAGEEWGFLGSLLLIFFYYLLIARGIKIAEKAKDPCGKLLAVGLLSIIGIQVIVNLSMTMGFMPVVGIPLPLISYGGSSLLVTLISVALLESIAIHR